MHQPRFTWFDAHLDLAYMAVSGRNMHAPPEKAGGNDLPAAITLPSLAEGGVRHCLATIFTEPDGDDPSYGFPAGDIEAAAAAGRRQLDVYRRWSDEGKLVVVGGRQVATSENSEILHARILIEGADPIRNPGELTEWIDAGVAAIGLVWGKPGRYAGGNMTDLGLTALGKDLVRAIDDAGIFHDLSHLSDRATDELLAASAGKIIASHSNCRALVDDGSGGGSAAGSSVYTRGVPAFQRHLRDEVIREIGGRGGVVGINLYSPFLIRGGLRDSRAGVREVIAHIERVCELTGSKRHVGLGSDMDGGFSALTLPAGIGRPKDLEVLATGLMEAGWSRSEVEGFAIGNWSRVMDERTEKA